MNYSEFAKNVFEKWVKPIAEKINKFASLYASKIATSSYGQKYAIDEQRLKVSILWLIGGAVIFILVGIFYSPSKQSNGVGNRSGTSTSYCVNYVTVGPVVVNKLWEESGTWKISTTYYVAGSSVPTHSTEFISPNTVETPRGLGKIKLAWRKC